MATNVGHLGTQPNACMPFFGWYRLQGFVIPARSIARHYDPGPMGSIVATRRVLWRQDGCLDPRYTG